MSKPSPARQHGFTIAELAFSLLIFMIGTTMLVNHLMVNYSTTQLQNERVFAYSKAQAILAELQTYVDRGAAVAAVDLDTFDDGVTNRPTLTIAKDGGQLVSPTHPLSNNLFRDGDWLWSRRITVRPFQGANNRNVRYVTVRIYKRKANGTSVVMATISSVIQSLASAFPPTQVYDMYLIAIENIPGWWVYMESMRPFFESTITDLQSRNPGLEIRTHWITKAGFGRNPWYTPYTNDTTVSTDNIPSVYYYPGLMPDGSASSYYYVPTAMRARVRVDGTVQHGYDADTNPYPYALADWFNHAMRYPREKALNDQRVAAAAARRNAIADAERLGNPMPARMDDESEEPTLRVLLEEMCTNPDKYRRAMMLNLHGELLPLPSLRNYSDAAKDPEYLPEVRVVTHPEELRTKTDDHIYLRVYAYVTSPDHYAGSATMPASRPIAIKVMGMDLTNGLGGIYDKAEINRLPGGVAVGGDSNYYSFTSAKGKPPTKLLSLVPNEMSYSIQFVDPGPGLEKYTLFKLYNTPVKATAAGGKGLPNTTRCRLYGLEYIPSCCEAAGTFATDLTSTAATPKNTARWRIKIPKDCFSAKRFVTPAGVYYKPANATLAIQTSIWDDTRTLAENNLFGQVDPKPADLTLFRPDNFSETYSWWADTVAAVPITERYQFQGDPRHNPYKDLLAVSTSPDVADGYNCYFDSLNNSGQNAAADFPAISGAALKNRWMGRHGQDLPRFLQVLRTALVNTGSVFTTLTGFSYFYVGFGNEIGYDSANGYPTAIPTNLKPWGLTTSGFVDDITNDQGEANAHRGYVRTAANYWGTYFWWGMPWLGELSPDGTYTAQWKLLGNLNAGTGATDCYRRTENVLYTSAGNRNVAYGTALTLSSHRSKEEGCTSLFNIGSSASTFHHQYSSGTGNLVEAGPELGSSYNFPMPSTASITRPFKLNTNGSGGVGNEFSLAPYSTLERGAASLFRRYYDHTSGGIGSGIVQLSNKGGTSSAFMVVNGLAATVDSGSSFIAKYAVLSLVQTYLEAGSTSLPAAHRIKQLPRLSIVHPNESTELSNPTSIPIQVQVEWKRWDGIKYTTGTPAAFTESESELRYVYVCSKDGGDTWLQVEDGTPATPGTMPTNPVYLHADAGAGNESLVWSVPAATFPKGTYQLRVEAYRVNQALHYSMHETKIYVDR